MKKRPFKILLPADSEAFHTERIAAEYRRQGCRLMIASLERGPIHHFHLRRRGPVRRLHYSFASLQMRELIERFKPDVINPHYASGYGFMTAQATRRKHVPTLLNLWGSDILIVPGLSILHRLKTIRALKAADHVVGDSHYLIEAAKKLIPLENTSVIPWGIERCFLSLHRSDYRFNSPLRIIVPRTQAEVYNNQFVLESLSDMVRNGRITLTFPAFGPLADKFREKAGELTGRGVTLYERTDRPGFLKMTAAHDVFLSASRSDSSPASLIEAMALGLVPVAAEIDGVAEWLTSESGFLFRQDDSENLQRVIESILTAAEPFTEMRRNNLARVRKEAIFEDNIAEQLTIMKNLAGMD
ncbi:MAG TPA: glycosyltransferase [candidate division Zixibacteria bacterium]|nr:glycosyltransferase [candidate division Zixibacteria bacterium]